MELINNIKDFNKLYNESYANFLRFAVSYVRDQHIAEDFVSESYTTYWEKTHELSEDTNPKAYILTVLRNKCLNHLQHLKVRQRVEGELSEHANWLLTININSLNACDPDFIFSKEIKNIVDNTINQLSDKTQQVFILSRKKNLTNKEIAKEMKFSEKSVEYHISKALSLLRLSLKDFIVLAPFFSFLC